MIRYVTILFFFVICSLQIFASTLPGGTYTVGKKAGDNFPTLDSVINTVNRGITGAVTLLLTDTGYTETKPLVIKPEAGTSAINTITIKPKAGVSVRISGYINTAIFKIRTSYVTIDGNNAVAGKNLTITNTFDSTKNPSAVIWFADSVTLPGATHNTIQNCNIYGNSSTTTFACIFSGGSTIGLLSYALTGNAYNTIQNNTISKAQNGIYVLGTSTAKLDSGLKIINNSLGSNISADGFIESGIAVKYQTGSTIRGNNIQNLVYNGSNVLRDGSNHPINAGLYLFNSTNTKIDSNKVHNIHFSGLIQRLCYGISSENFAFNTSANASNNYVYNNMIYDATDSGFGVNGWLYSGINENGGYNDHFYYNTVYVSEGFSPITTGSVAAFSNGNTASTVASNALIVENNIFDIDSITAAKPGTSFYCHYSTLTNDLANTWNANNLYFNVNKSFGTGCIGYYNGKRDTTLTQWQAATGLEVKSQNIKTVFLSPAFPIDVHLTSSDKLNFGLRVTNPVTIATDIDGNARSLTAPFVGADEINNILPVTFLAFTAQKQNNTTLLKWQTANEINNSYFSIERSPDSKLFISIGNKPATDNELRSNYTFVDETPLSGMNYYRLKQVDKDGKFAYSNVVSVDFSNDAVTFAVYPNPVSNTLNVTLPSINKTSAIVLYDATGKEVLHEQLAPNMSSKQISISKLPAGVYNVVLVKTGKQQIIKVVVKK